METTTAAGRRDPWPGALFVLHAGQALAFAAAHPLLRAGTDLVAYFVYFRSWWTGDTSLRTNAT